MKDATDIYQEMVNIGKKWVKEKAELVKEFPVLPNGEKGLVVGGSLSYYYYKVLLPNGRLAWFHHSSWDFKGYVSDKHYLSQTTLNEVDQAVKTHCKLSTSQPSKRRWGLSLFGI